MENGYDALLLLSFGGPEGPDDVVPFLENVTRGRNIPRERLREVGQHYFLFGGVSPINGACRSLVAALEGELGRMADDGIRRAVAVATSAYSSYSACRQYLEDIERARAAVGEHAPSIEKIQPFWNHPGFIETMAENTARALGALGADAGAERMRIVFTAHSIPCAMAATCDYEAELREASALVVERAAPGFQWELAYQSRSGSPAQPWLEPDVCDRVRALRASGVDSVVLVPIGFVADHMEVLYDLDTDARSVADEIGLRMARAATVGSAPRFVAGLRELIADHVAGRTPRALGTRGPRPYPCAPGCCAYTPSGRPAP